MIDPCQFYALMKRITFAIAHMHVKLTVIRAFYREHKGMVNESRENRKVALQIVTRDDKRHGRGEDDEFLNTASDGTDENRSDSMQLTLSPGDGIHEDIVLVDLVIVMLKLSLQTQQLLI